MDKIYIISRYRAETEEELELNKKVARHFCQEIIEEGNVPVAPHLYYPQFLDDNDPEDRSLGLRLGIRDLRESKEYLLVIVGGEISEGMAGEIEEIGRLGMKGRIVSMTKQEAEELVK